MSAVHRHFFVHGLVQGVGYRWSMAQAAAGLGVRGWVRNRRDGSVEALVCGEAAAVEALLEWARRGPPDARVDRIEVEVWTGPEEGFGGFLQRETI